MAGIRPLVIMLPMVGIRPLVIMFPMVGIRPLVIMLDCPQCGRQHVCSTTGVWLHTSFYSLVGVWLHTSFYSLWGVWLHTSFYSLVGCVAAYELLRALIFRGVGQARPIHSNLL